jgi:hypothetical protein
MNEYRRVFWVKRVVGGRAERSRTHLFRMIGRAALCGRALPINNDCLFVDESGDNLCRRCLASVEMR